MIARIFLLTLLPLLNGCAGRMTAGAVVRTLTPETVSIGLTAPNLVNGPIAATKTGESRRDSVGVVGITLSATYRLKAIRIERAEVQPVAVVSPSPFPENGR